MCKAEDLSFLVGARIICITNREDGKLVIWVHDREGKTGTIIAPVPFYIEHLDPDSEEVKA